jgi:TolB-like protein/cytochrome c-type biogenesis protein CcmH/NrfG
MVIGTVAYMSPEQARGKPLDHRSDLFSFGVLLYEMVTGQLPFTGDSDVESLSSTLTHEPAAPSRLIGDLPAEADRVVRKLLEKNPADRYQYADELATDLRNLRRDLDTGKTTMPTTAISGVALRPDTGPVEKQRSWTRIIVGVTAAAVLIAVTAWFVLRPGDELSTSGVPAGSASSATNAPAAPERKMIVVLPFQNLGASEDEFFADGMTEEITSRLGSLSDLKVISRSSAFQYDRTDKTMQQIGADFGVDYILDGTVRWAKDSGGASRVRITPELIRAADDTQVWAESYDQVIDDIFEVQSEIANEVAGQLGVALGRSQRGTADARPTEDTEAYQMYLRGRHHSAWGLDATEENFLLSIRLFERAIELDPDFVLAYCWLSRQHSAMYHWGYDRTSERQALAKSAVDRALKLAPEEPEAHLAIGYYHYWAHKAYEPALREFDIALEGLPNSADLHEAIAYVLRRQGRFEEAVASLERAAALNPINGTVQASIGETLTNLRRFNDAIEAFDRSIALSPDAATPFISKASAYYQLEGGPNEDSREALEAMPETPDAWSAFYYDALLEGEYTKALGLVAARDDESSSGVGTLRPLPLLEAWAFDLLGRDQESKRSYEAALTRLEHELRERSDDFRVHAALGLTLAGLGRKDEAIRAADRAVELYPISKDALAGTMPMIDRVFTYTIVGDYDAAFDDIETLLSVPSLMTVSRLQFEPQLAPLRNHPRYLEIVNRFSL